jgi:hypothetical protein
MKLTKAQKEIYDDIVYQIKCYDKKITLENIIDELKHQIETEVWHKEEYDDSYSDLNVRVAKNLLKLLIKERVSEQLTNVWRKEFKGRGGKRQGAGRPVGTTKENTKKMYSFRLSEEEEKAVRELLKKMRNR